MGWCINASSLTYHHQHQQAAVCRKKKDCSPYSLTTESAASKEYSVTKQHHDLRVHRCKKNDKKRQWQQQRRQQKKKKKNQYSCCVFVAIIDSSLFLGSFIGTTVSIVFTCPITDVASTVFTFWFLTPTTMQILSNPTTTFLVHFHCIDKYRGGYFPTESI